MAHPQHNFTSNFNGSEGHNAELTLNINGTEHKYTPAGNDKEFTVTGAVRINVNLDGSELVERITTVLNGNSLPLLVQQNLDGTEDSYTYVGLQDNEWLFGRVTTTHIDSVGINTTDGSVRRETLPLASDVAIVSNTDPAVYTKLRTAVALGHLPVLDYQGTYATYVTIDNNILKFATEAADPNVESYVYTVASDNTVTATPRNAGVVRADSVDTEPGTLIDKLEVVDNVRDPDDPDDPALLTLGVTVDGQGKRKVAINEDNLRNFVGDMVDGFNNIQDALNGMDFDAVPHGSFGSSLNQSPGDGTTTSIQISIFRPIETTVGDAIAWTKTTEIGGEDFGTVTLEPGTYIICSDITCQWVGVPAGTYLPQVGNVLGEPFDFSQQQEVHRRMTNVVTVSTTTQFKMRISFDAATPVMGFWINSAQIVKVAGGMSQTNVAHDGTLTGKGSVAEPLGVTTEAFGKVKDIPTSISQFRNGDVIPVDGPNGPAKMTADSLVKVNTDNALEKVGQLAAGFANDTYSEKGLKIATMIKKIAFYDPQNIGEDFKIYLVTLVNSNQTLQITLQYNNTYYDFKVNEGTQTGIKEYLMLPSNQLPNNKLLKVTFDWSAYESVTGGTDLYVKSAFFNIDSVGWNTTGIELNITNIILTPRKRVEYSGVVSKIYLKSDIAGNAKILVGSIDENLKFNVRTSTEVLVSVGENHVDVKPLGIEVIKGENVGVIPPGKCYDAAMYGAEDNAFAFYYTESSVDIYQLKAYDVEGMFIAFSFAYIVESHMENQINTLQSQIDELNGLQGEKEKEALCSEIGFSSVYSTAKGEKVVSFVKKINLFDPNNSVGTEYLFYLITTTSSDTILQITLSRDGTYYDFKTACHDKSGVKDYVLFCNEMVIKCTIDWATYQSTTNISDLSLESLSFDCLAVGYNSVASNTQTLKSMLVPCKPVEEDCQITTIYNQSSAEGKIKICIGEVDQLLRFNVYAEYEVDVASGENYIDVSSLGIYARKGDYVGCLIVEARYFALENGLPADSKSFYYSTTSNYYQLEEFGVADKRIRFRFAFAYDTSEVSQMSSKIYGLESENKNFSEQLDIISDNIGFAYDSAGNKYKTRVVAGFVKAFALNFKHILVVGNSYTVHPTTEDTGVLATNRWWGHWSMAASRKETAWTTLLENNLKARDASSSVQPIFGRTYEMNGGIDNNDAFVYWDENGDLQSLYQNVSDFSNTDCIIFFLGDNYNGDDWYNRYKTMIEKFETLFPNALIFCMSARSRSSVNTAILQVATEKNLSYINVYGKAPSSRIGSYVEGDDGNLHQIADGAVAGHPGDFGQKDFVEIVSEAIAVENTTEFYGITLNNSNLEIEHTQRQAGAVVSVFGGDSVSSITVVQGSTPVNVTAHLATDYGNIFTFEMPAGNVEIS